MVTRGPIGNQRITNSGLANRTDRRLQGIAEAKAAQFETSLAVDGVVAFLWNKVKGTTQCTCRGLSSRPFNQPLKGVSTPKSPAVNGVVSSSGNGTSNVGTAGKFTYVGEHLTRQNLDGFLASKHYDKPSYKKQALDSKTTEDFHEQTGDYNDDFDIVEALENEEVEAATNILGPSLGLPSRTSGCPICLGAGTVDTWQLYNGQRIVLDYSTRYDLDLGGSTIEPEQPASFVVYDGMQIRWKNVNFPHMWRSLLRLAVFNRGKMVDPDEYALYLVMSTAPNTLIPLTFNSLVAMNQTTFGVASVDVIITPLVDKLKFTHVEALFSLGDAVIIQMPEVEVGDDSQFADWNLTITIEVSANVELRESSYIVDGKYKRVWKVVSINRKMTAAGKSFGYSVSARALHPTEKAYVMLNVLGKPLDPFSSIVDDLIDEL